MSSADRTLVILATLTCTGLTEPASLSRPRCSASSCERYRSAAIQLSLAWVSWKDAMGLPNCSRVLAYSIALSRQVRAAPVTPHAMPNLASVRHDSGPLSEARFGIAWGVTGAARTCLESAIEYAKTREQFGKPIASFQLTQAKLSWMAADLY